MFIIVKSQMFLIELNITEVMVEHIKLYLHIINNSNNNNFMLFQYGYYFSNSEKGVNLM